MKKIDLTKGKYALVDDDIYEELSQYKWHARQNGPGGKWYAIRTKGRKRVFMHRQIMKAPKGLHVDHINGDGLDNRKSNLRFATDAQNARNRGKTRRNTTGYKGVSRQKGRRKFRAQIQVHGKPIYLGWYDTAPEAARAYDRAVRKYHGRFGCKNFPAG